VGKVSRDRVDRFGKLTLRYLGRLRHIPVGVAHQGAPIVAGADVRVSPRMASSYTL